MAGGSKKMGIQHTSNVWDPKNQDRNQENTDISYLLEGTVKITDFRIKTNSNREQNKSNKDNIFQAVQPASQHCAADVRGSCFLGWELGGR